MLHSLADCVSLNVARKAPACSHSGGYLSNVIYLFIPAPEVRLELQKLTTKKDDGERRGVKTVGEQQIES